jgi:hypothetical protein
VTYNDPYNNGLRTLDQAIQVRDYYNKTYLPPYGDHATQTSASAPSSWPGQAHVNDAQYTIRARKRSPAQMREINTVKEEDLPDVLKDLPPTRTTNADPNLSIIVMDQDPAEGSQVTLSQGSTQNEANNSIMIDALNHWRQDATTLLETEYMVWLSMERNLGLRTGQVINIALLEAVASAQLRIRWKGMQFREITTLVYPQERGEYRVTYNRARTSIRKTEAVCFLYPTSMHFNAVLALRHDSQVVLIWCDI